MNEPDPDFTDVLLHLRQISDLVLPAVHADSLLLVHGRAPETDRPEANVISGSPATGGDEPPLIAWIQSLPAPQRGTGPGSITVTSARAGAPELLATGAIPGAGRLSLLRDAHGQRNGCARIR